MFVQPLFRPLALTLISLAFAGCASAQTAIERRFIPDGEILFPQFADAAAVTNAGSTDTPVDNSAWNTFLRAYAQRSDDGIVLVDYATVTDEDRIGLERYIAALEATDPASLTSDEQLAFWINLYNAETVALILENYPIKSIRQIKNGLFDFSGPWNDKRITVAGADLSLNDVEHNIIRVLFNEPRIHYAVNCAAIGCPNLRLTAYDGASLDAALDERARDYINHPRGVSVDDRGRVTASKIFAWYREDFGDNEVDVLNHIRVIADPDLREKLDGKRDIRRYEYDWTLNDPALRQGD